ncbi:hypothetical protein K469DRAFT_732063 [Zopfia rhizophila CBS 207.26]|uniref:ATP-dependent DNA ligase family profile domain-containing protein n=1 Tax=Zopfia rhizophila CBS 207.26 TaxID=1314779 RepID=A0A6A6EIT5_9PEZI|nr:hypothetical protein K469DRAFT_732063 [Zopfia rhizophila CBS 207.26]
MSIAYNDMQRALFDRWTDQTCDDLGVYAEKDIKPWDGTFKRKNITLIEQVDRLLVQLVAEYRFSELGFVFKCYHSSAPGLLLFQNDFDAVAGLLKGELSCYLAVPGPSLERSMRIEAAKQLKPVVGAKVCRPEFRKAWSFKHRFQLVGDRACAAEAKYDGIHINLYKCPDDIRIFSKNGKGANDDRRALHRTIREALRKILQFSEIRKYVRRSGVLVSTLQGPLRHEWEHHMITMISFKTEDGIIDLKQRFAQTLADCEEGLVLKPLHSPYLPLLSESGKRELGYFIGLKDYLSDMGGEHDLGDFAIIGASYDAQLACNLEKCIPKPEVKFLNQRGLLQRLELFIAEIQGGGYEKVQNETFEMLRHPRIKKEVLNTDKLDGHVEDVALLAKKYRKQENGSQNTATEYETPQENAQQTTPRTTQEIAQDTPDDGVVQGTRRPLTREACTTTSTTQSTGSIQGLGIKASIQISFPVREDTAERLVLPPFPQPQTRLSSSLRRFLLGNDQFSTSKDRSRDGVLTRETTKNLETFECDSQEKVIHIYAEEGWMVKVHSGKEESR